VWLAVSSNDEAMRLRSMPKDCQCQLLVYANTI